MINYLKNNEIDREKWDSCVMAVPRVKPYGYSWYLDNMAPGWTGLVDNDYDSVFPVTGFRRFGIHYIATPVFLQQLGVYSHNEPEKEAVSKFLQHIPSFYRLIDLCVGQKTNTEMFRVSEMTNYELDLSTPYDELWKNFSKHCKRNVERSERSKPEITTEVTTEELVGLYLQNRGAEIKGVRSRDYRRLKNLMKLFLEAADFFTSLQ